MSNLMLVAAMGAVFFGEAAHAAPQTPGAFPPPAIRITADPAASERPRVAIDPDGNAVVVWQDARHGNYEILWQKVSLDGSPLTGVERVTQSATASVWADVSCDAAGKSHVVWQEGQSSGVGTVKLGAREASGIPGRWDVGVMDFSGHAKIAALAGGEADVVWYRRLASDQDVYYRRYQPDGTYACQRRLTGAWPDMEKDPAVAIIGGTDAALVWSDMSLFSDPQLRQGTISYLCELTPGATFIDDALRSTIDVAGARTERAFQLNNRIYRRTSGGVCAIANAASGASYPSVGTTEATSYAVWRDSRSGGGDIYFCNYLDCTNLSGDQPLILSPGESTLPDIAVNHVNGEWIAVWQENVSGNTEIYMTSSRLLAAPPSYAIAGATFDKQLYFNGTDIATITVVTQSFAGEAADLTLHASIESNLGDQYVLSADAFSLSPVATHVSTFTWPVPERELSWNFDLDLELRHGMEVVATARLSGGARGTELTQGEIDLAIAEATDNECAPPVTPCALYMIGLIPGFHVPAALVSFKAAVCEMGRQSRLGNYHYAALSGLKADRVALHEALEAIPDMIGSVKFLAKHALGAYECLKDGFDPSTSALEFRTASSPTIDSLAAFVRDFQTPDDPPFAYELFAQGAVGLAVGVEGSWTTVDSLALTQTLVYPTLGAGFQWADVGPAPVPVGTSEENPASAVDIEIRSEADAPMEFGLLHTLSPDSVVWIRYPAISMQTGAVARISLSDSTTVYPLAIDQDGDGTPEVIWLPDGTVVGVQDRMGRGAAGLWLRQGTPNPTARATTFEFGLPRAGRVDLAIYDASGRRIAVLAGETRSAGTHTVVWDGRGRDGTMASPGVYWARMVTPWGARAGRVVIVE